MTETRMKYGHVAGLNKPVSRIVMGASWNDTMEFTQCVFDAYLEAGGTTFDTSRCYFHGACERNLGEWIRGRGVRDQVVIIGKGANPPNGDAAGLTRELLESLDQMGLDHLDIYMIHRDSPETPVEEFIDVLNEHQRTGKFALFGASNFSLPRFVAAQEYARQSGQNGFSVLSNQLSLAEMLDDPWPDVRTESCWDPDWRDWLAQAQLPLFPWSSQARGFFAEPAGRDDNGDPDLVRCWHNEDNFRRRERAAALAEELGYEAIHVALAWVLHQPFPTFPMVGPLTPGEARSCLRALEIELTPRQCAWLEGCSRETAVSLPAVRPAPATWEGHQ